MSKSISHEHTWFAASETTNLKRGCRTINLGRASMDAHLWCNILQRNFRENFYCLELLILWIQKLSSRTLFLVATPGCDRRRTLTALTFPFHWLTVRSRKNIWSKKWVTQTHSRCSPSFGRFLHQSDRLSSGCWKAHWHGKSRGNSVPRLLITIMIFVAFAYKENRKKWKLCLQLWTTLYFLFWSNIKHLINSMKTLT